MPADNTSLDVQISFDGEDDIVRAADFVEWLRDSLSILRRLEHNPKAQIDYTVAYLGIGSATVRLRAEPKPKAQINPVVVLTRYREGLEALSSGTIGLLGFEPELQRAFEDLAKPLKRSLRRVTVDIADTRVQLIGQDFRDGAWTRQMETASTGQFSGYVEAINVHGVYVFYLYPVAGPARIRCVFADELLEQVRAGLKQYVTVSGLAEYLEGSAFPLRIVVESVEVHLPEDQLPSLDDLYGVAPDLTAGVESAEFVRRLRDAEA